MFRRVLFLSIALLILSFLVVSCTSQPVAPVVNPPAPTGERVVTITGKVEDCVTGKPLPAATVKIEYREGGTLFTSTDSEGFFEIKVPLGTVTITITKTGYIPQSFYSTLSTPGAIVRITARLCVR
jgi:hypothetical protein